MVSFSIGRTCICCSNYHWDVQYARLSETIQLKRLAKNNFAFNVEQFKHQFKFNLWLNLKWKLTNQRVKGHALFPSLPCSHPPVYLHIWILATALPSLPLLLNFLLSLGCAEGYARDATEIQNIQIADGDVCRGLPIPIYMVFPRLFTCPTLETTNFKVGKQIGSYALFASSIKNKLLVSLQLLAGNGMNHYARKNKDIYFPVEVPWTGLYFI